MLIMSFDSYSPYCSVIPLKQDAGARTTCALLINWTPCIYICDCSK